MRVWRGAGRWVPVALMAMLLAGCEGDPTPSERELTGSAGAPDQSSEAATTSETAPAADDPLGPAQASPEPTVTAKGTVPTIDGQVEAGVISVEPVGEQTRVVWALRSVDGSDLAVDYLNGLVGDRGTTDDVRAASLGLADGTRLKTLLAGNDSRGTVVTLGCLCSNMPDVITGEWTMLSSTFPELPEGADAAGLTFQLPGAGEDRGISLSDLPLTVR